MKANKEPSQLQLDANTTKRKRAPITEETRNKLRQAKLGKSRDPELMKAIGKKLHDSYANGSKIPPHSGHMHSETSKEKIRIKMHLLYDSKPATKQTVSESFW